MDNSTAASSSPSSLAGPQHSQWLHTTLSDFEEKLKSAMTLLEEDDKSSSRKAHVSDHNWKQELVQLLGELNRSYSSLIKKYDQLRSESQTRSGSSSFMSSNSTEIQQAILEASDSRPESVLHHPDFKHHKSNSGYLNKLADDLMLTEQCSMSFTGKPEQTNREFSDEEDVVLQINRLQIFKPEAAEFQKGSSERENSWFQLKRQFTKLMEENLRQQAELLRRNDEKRQTINKLRLQLEHLKSENKALQKCHHCSKIGVNRSHSQTSKSTGLFLGKFFHVGCS